MSKILALIPGITLLATLAYTAIQLAGVALAEYNAIITALMGG